MVRARYTEHCIGGKLLIYSGDDNYYCSICRKQIKIEEHWYGDKLIEIG